MRLCSCGFANPDSAVTCTACGAALDTGSENPLGATSWSPSSGAGSSALRDGRHEAATEGDREVAPTNGGAAASVDAATGICAAMGVTTGTEGVVSGIPSLLLEELRTGAVVAVPAPGGVLGRAGDFEPNLFSPRVSGVHAVVAMNAEGRWTIEHTGRNESSVERAGVWSVLRAGCPQPLFGGETLKLADMVFRVKMAEPSRDPSTPALRASARDDVVEDARRASAQDDVVGDVSPSEPNPLHVIPSERSESRDPVKTTAVLWSVRCPVCGTEHAVSGPTERVAACTFCSDPFDQQQIARVVPRSVERSQ